FVLDGGAPSSSECLVYCDGGASFCMPATDAGPNAVDCIIRCVGGRAPPGLLSLASAGAGAAGWLARTAALEASSVAAFEQLARELSAHGLSRFALAAKRGARDEARHARIIGRLALAAGATPRRPVVAATPIRSLEAIACDNAA